MFGNIKALYIVIFMCVFMISFPKSALSEEVSESVLYEQIKESVNKKTVMKTKSWNTPNYGDKEGDKKEDDSKATDKKDSAEEPEEENLTEQQRIWNKYKKIADESKETEDNNSEKEKQDNKDSKTAKSEDTETDKEEEKVPEKEAKAEEKEPTGIAAILKRYKESQETKGTLNSRSFGSVDQNQHNLILCLAQTVKSWFKAFMMQTQSTQIVKRDKADIKNPLATLSELLEEDMRNVNRIILENMQSDVALIPQLAQYLIAAGGKRIRPLLTLASTAIFNGPMDKSYHLAAAVEFIHTATLLHDDVVDESLERRGQQAANLIFGNQASVLVGDFLFSKAFQMMVTSESLRILSILSDASAVIAEGEVLQLSTTNDIDTTLEAYLQVIKSKTAALFAASCEVGPVLSQASEDEVDAMRQYGTNIGIAFQIIDDALDYNADQAKLGKEIGDDFKEGKMTAPVIFAIQNATDEEKAFWQRTLGDKQQNDCDFEQALQIIRKHRSFDTTMELAEKYAHDAKATLSHVPHGPYRVLLEDLTDYVLSRSFQEHPMNTHADDNCCDHSEHLSCHSDGKKMDVIFSVSMLILVLMIGGNALAHLLSLSVPEYVHDFSHASTQILMTMWWGVAIGIVVIGFMNNIPRDYFTNIMGRSDTFSGLIRAVIGGLFLDLCCHGILLVAAKLYERGVSYAQVVTFLVSSPWNSVSLTLVLVGLIGLKFTLLYILGSMLIAVITGFILQKLTKTGYLPDNPNTPESPKDVSLLEGLKSSIKTSKPSLKGTLSILASGWKDGKTIIKWLLFGTIIAASLRTFVPMDVFAEWLGPNVLGLFITLLVATVVEICSEGSAPVAGEIVTTAHAPGNGFTFLMAGVATDYTELLAIKEFTGKWTLAFAVPLITVPQVLFIGWLLNMAGQCTYTTTPIIAPQNRAQKPTAFNG